MPDRILVIDDDEDILEIVHSALTEEDFVVSTAGTSDVALRLIESQRPDLIVLDVMMESHDSGHKLCRRIVGDFEIPVIFLTARASDIDAIVGLELGADDYVTKPFSTRVLVSRIRTVLRRLARAPRRPDEDTRQFDVGEFIVDETRSSIETSNGRRELSRTEFLLLFALSSDVGRVFRRDELIERVYGSPDAASLRTVDSHLRGLRAKMNEIGHCPIETVRGVGYKLVADSNGGANER